MESKILLYSTALGNVNINVTYQNENFWLSQKAIATLFGVEVPAISKHLANIYE
ncbi:MAG: cell filamentation protein Fic, partial [Methylotenera sp.]|nr:cell filamentation protein Fic [Flavobacterium sp.]